MDIVLEFFSLLMTTLIFFGIFVVVGGILSPIVPPVTSQQGLWIIKMQNECHFLNGKSRYIKENKTFECWYLGTEPKKIIEEKWKE